MGAYLMMFASLAIGLPIPLVNLIASVIYFLVNRRTRLSWLSTPCRRSSPTCPWSC